MALRTVFNPLAVQLPPRLQGGLSLAGNAPSPALHSNARVLGSERVTVDAMSLYGFLGRKAFAAQDVYTSRDGLKVRWANARPSAAEVVELEAVRDGAVRVYVSPSMCRHGARESARAEHPIAGAVDGARPDPALPGLIDFGPETRCHWAGNVLGVLHGDIAVAAKANVVGVAHSALVGGRGAVSNRTATIARHLGLILRGVTRATVTAVRPLSIVPRREVSPWHAA